MGKIWMIASGKGGVGKSTVAASLAVYFAKKALRTLIVDADVGLRNLDLILGLQNKVLYELDDCILKRCTLEDAMVSHNLYPNLYLLVGGQNAKPSDFGKSELKKMFSTIKKYFDIVIIDCPAGIGRGLKNFIDLSDESILVATPDPICIRDTEKTADILFSLKSQQPYLVLNKAQGKQKPSQIAMSLDMKLLGAIPLSEKLHKTMVEGKPVLESGDKGVLLAFDRLASRIQGVDIPLKFEDNIGSLKGFFETLKGDVSFGA
ncbi:MAG: P-loop NTPase [Eubacteriales bacterium]|nr:P-loop NTPase [Eubacteriales bacterium]